MNTEIAMMAIAAGKPVSETPNFPVYTGVMTLNVIAINPNKKELEAIYNRPFEKEPEYFGTDPRTGVRRLRIDFICKTIAEKCNGVEIPMRITTWLSDAVQYNTDKTKVKVINPYGQTAWLTKEEFQEKRLPENISSQLFIMEDPRPCLIGEERLMNLIQASVNIPRIVSFSGDMLQDKTAAYCRFDSIREMVSKGNITELKATLPAMKLFKLGAGARITDDNRIYQDWYLDYPMRGGVNDFQYYDRNLQKNAGRAYPNTNFGTMPYEVTEYKVTPTNSKDLIGNTMGTVGITDDLEAGW